jgi:zinc protease
VGAGVAHDLTRDAVAWDTCDDLRRRRRLDLVSAGQPRVTSVLTCNAVAFGKDPRMRKLALLALLGIAATCTPTIPKYSIKYSEKRGTIGKNGLRFVVMPDETTQMVEVDVRYDVGSREDPIGKAGLAHLVEHLMFQQKPDGPTTPPLMHFINQLTTFFNAFTEWDKTHYMQLSRADMLDSMLKIEAMRMYFRCQTITQDEFEREREVVRNEIRLQGDAKGQVEQLLLGAVYPEGHAYARSIGGNDKQLATITLKDACDFMDKYYTPERAVVVVAGGVQLDPTVTAIEKWFGNIDKRPSAPRTPVAPVTLTRSRVQYDVDVERPQVLIAWALPPSNTPEGERAQFGIWNAFFSTLFQAEKWHFATQVQPQVLGGQLAPVFVIQMELKDFSKVDEAIGFAMSAASQAHRGFEGGMWQELQEAKARSKANFIEGMERLTDRTLQIAELVQFSKEVDFASGDIYIKHELDKIDSYDGDAIRSAVKNALDPDKAKIIVIHNTKEGIHGDVRSDIAFQTKSDTQKELPEVDPKEALHPLKVAAQDKILENAKRFTLDNGMKVVLLKVDALPLVSAHLQFDVGDAMQPPDSQYAAQFLHGSLEDEKLRTAGVGVRCQADLDTTYCFSSGVNIYLDVILNGLERQIIAGDYSQEGIEEAQRAFHERMKLKEEQAAFEYRRQITTALYGADHPYAKASLVTPEMVDTLGHDKLASFGRTHYSAANATLVVAGNFDLAEGERLARQVFGGWGHGTDDKPAPASSRPRTGPEYIGVVADRERPFSGVTIAYPGPAGIDGQQAAREVLSEMLNIRMEDIRFKLGSTYGTYARFSEHVGPGAYQMGGNIDTPRTGESLKAMRAGVAILQHVAAGNATQEETDQFMIDFVRARRKLIQELLGVSTVSGELSTRLGYIASHDLPANYYNQLLQRVAAMSPAQVKALIAAELKPEDEIIVTKGTREGIEKTFAEAGITKVKIVEPEYK